MNWATIVISIVSAIFASGGTAALVTAVSRRKVTSAEAAGALTDSAIELLNVAKADARQSVSEARNEAAEAKREAIEARRQMRIVRQEAEIVVNYLRRVVTMIHDPGMTMDRLRVLVGEDSMPNGNAQGMD